MIQALEFHVVSHDRVNVKSYQLDHNAIIKEIDELVKRCNHFYSSHCSKYNTPGIIPVSAMTYHRYNHIQDELTILYYIDYDSNIFKMLQTEFEVMMDVNGRVCRRDSAHFSIVPFVDEVYPMTTSTLPSGNVNSNSPGITMWYDEFMREQPSLDEVLTRAASAACSHDWRRNKQDEEGVYDWCARCGEKNYTQRRKTWL